MTQIQIPPDIAQLPPAELIKVAAGLMEMAIARLQGQIDLTRFDLETHETLLNIRNEHGTGEAAQHVMAYQEQRTREAQLFVQGGPSLATDPLGGVIIRAGIEEREGKHVVTLLCAPGPFKALHMSEYLGTTADEALAAAQAAASKAAMEMQAKADGKGKP